MAIQRTSFDGAGAIIAVFALFLLAVVLANLTAAAFSTRGFLAVVLAYPAAAAFFTRDFQAVVLAESFAAFSALVLTAVVLAALPGPGRNWGWRRWNIGYAVH